MLWTSCLLRNCKESCQLHQWQITRTKCLCCKKCCNLGGRLLHYTSCSSVLNRFILGNILDNCCVLHHLLHCNFWISFSLGLFFQIVSFPIVDYCCTWYSWILGHCYIHEYAMLSLTCFEDRFLAYDWCLPPLENSVAVQISNLWSEIPFFFFSFLWRIFMLKGSPLHLCWFLFSGPPAWSG